MVIYPNEVHLWCTHDEDIVSSALLSEYRKLLNPEETKLYQSFYFPHHRHQYLITRALVRTVLSQYISEMFPQDLIFNKNKYGKPYIDNKASNFPLKFNISHSEKLVVLAVTFGLDVGVDVEYVLRKENIGNFAYRYFSPNEVKELRSLEHDKRHNRFFDFWTLKEAYIKAKGKGLSIPLDTFWFSIEGGNITISFDKKNICDNPSHWKFWQMTKNKSHRIALAVVANEHFQIDHLLLSMREIIPLLSSEIVY